MKMMQKSLLALAVLATTAVSAQAASSVDLKVIGTISPSACTPTISSNGTVDYGTILPTSLSDSAVTQLTPKETTFDITCAAPNKVAIKAINARVGSAAQVTELATGAAAAPSSLGWTNFNVVGLGMNGTEKIGGYTVYFKGTPSTNLGNSDTVLSDDSGKTWKKDGQNSVYGNTDAPRLMTVAATGKTTPEAFTTFNGRLAVQAYINKASELSVDKDIKLDGLTTIEMVYLP